MIGSTELSGQTLAVILAGGAGRRLGALTRERSKPALPFGGRYRSVDFTLSNCVNSGIRRIGIATQYQAQSLIRHIRHGWGFLHRELGEFVELWPAGQAYEARWYAGTADAVYQNLDAIDRHAPSYVLVLAADHVYRMDYSSLLESHRESGADLTIACQPVSAEQACHFGIMSIEQGEIRRFQEKPLGVAGGDDVLASMGVYVFSADLLRAALCEDAGRENSSHDFGRDVIPSCVRRPGLRVCAHRFRDPCTGGPGYWRDIGTVDAYWAANMELLSPGQGLDLHDPRWPIWCAPDRSPPTRVTSENNAVPAVVSQAIIAGGCRLNGATVQGSVLFNDVCVGPGSVIEDSILLPGARIGASCRIRRTIVDEGVELADGTTLGESPIADRHRYEVSPGGVTVLSTGPGNAWTGKELSGYIRRRVADKTGAAQAALMST